MLIVGGLIAIGVVALILAFAVVRLDRPDAAAPRAIATSAGSPVEANSTASVPRPEPSRPPRTPRLSKATVQLDGQFLEHEQSTFASGQFQEISGQLRMLLRQMQGLDQRLDTLTIMVEQLAEQQEGREEREEQEPAQSSVSTLARTPRSLKE